MAAVAPATDKTVTDNSPSTLWAFVLVVVSTVTSALSLLFVPDARKAVHRTSMFLTVFLVVHLSGNLLFFLGEDVYNSYSAMLHRGVLAPVSLCENIHPCSNIHILKLMPLSRSSSS